MYLRFLSFFFVALTSSMYADGYEFGHGYTLNDSLTVGGYISSEFDSNKQTEKLTIDDVAMMAYGNVGSNFSYLAEMEAIGFYYKNLTDGNEGGSQKFHVERLYGDIWVSDDFNFRVGKQIAPIGYWNLEPINVLRDTTSNPLYSMLLFPKFLTGINMNGYLGDTTRYHLFGQITHDLDEEYINIPNTHFYGLSLEHELSTDTNFGGSIGEFIALATDEKTQFIQGNLKSDNGTLFLSVEAIAAKTDYHHTKNDFTLSGYIQSVYHFSNEHALVGRYEYYNDQHRDYKDHIGILGYSYRPIYPISLKGEYQWHSQHDENRALFSFSVLF
ncbi:MAG: hypothetical protein V2A75_11100 [Pseudomonadota bacterium]